jgi:hypothetical protein
VPASPHDGLPKADAYTAPRSCKGMYAQGCRASLLNRSDKCLRSSCVASETYCMHALSGMCVPTFDVIGHATLRSAATSPACGKQRCKQRCKDLCWQSALGIVDAIALANPPMSHSTEERCGRTWFARHEYFLQTHYSVFPFMFPRVFEGNMAREQEGTPTAPCGLSRRAGR